MWRRGFEIAARGGVILFTALGGQPRALRHRKLFATTNREIDLFFAHGVNVRLLAAFASFAFTGWRRICIKINPVFSEDVSLGGEPTSNGATGGGAHVKVGQAGDGAGAAKVEECFGYAFDGFSAGGAEELAAAFIEVDEHAFAVPTSAGDAVAFFKSFESLAECLILDHMCFGLLKLLRFNFLLPQAATTASRPLSEPLIHNFFLISAIAFAKPNRVLPRVHSRLSDNG